MNTDQLKALSRCVRDEAVKPRPIDYIIKDGANIVVSDTHMLVVIKGQLDEGIKYLDKTTGAEITPPKLKKDETWEPPNYKAIIREWDEVETDYIPIGRILDAMPARNMVKEFMTNTLKEPECTPGDIVLITGVSAKNTDHKTATPILINKWLLIKTLKALKDFGAKKVKIGFAGAGNMALKITADNGNIGLVMPIKPDYYYIENAIFTYCVGDKESRINYPYGCKTGEVAC